MWLPIFAKFGFLSNRDPDVLPRSEKETEILTPSEKVTEAQQASGTIEGEIIRSKRPMTSLCRKVEPVVFVHGGAGNIADHVIPAKLDCVKKSAIAGFKVLKEGGSSVAAVEAAIRVMEDDPVMNAGYGSVLNIDGDVEGDACIMIGKTLDAGGVAGVKDIANPISLAKLVMETTPHALLSGEGAMKFATDSEFPFADPGSLVTTEAKEALAIHKKNKGELAFEISEVVENSEQEEKSLESVGAIAIDRDGRIAAGTSTGGLLGKMPGRVGDSPQIGKGAYCDDYVGGVSVTGHGEAITKFCLSMRILKEVEFGKNAMEATTTAIEQMKERLKQKAGAICITREGDVGMYWTTPRMSWAYQQGHDIHCGANPGEHITEEVVE